MNPKSTCHWKVIRMTKFGLLNFKFFCPGPESIYQIEKTNLQTVDPDELCLSYSESLTRALDKREYFMIVF